jgi:uncharacterized protein (TIGR02300 family)
MATKQQRGTKRTCQSGECGSRFYDLNRDPIVCPICGSVYDVGAQPVVSAAPAVAEKPARKAKKVEIVDEQEAPAPAGEVEGEEALAGIEAEEPAAAAGDETFLEAEEEDGGDVSNIIGGPVEGEEEG